MKKKILIYDSSRGYNRFIKLNFKDEFEVVSYFDYSNSKSIKYDEFEAIFFIINQAIELIDVFSVIKKSIPLFIGTRLSEITNRIKEIDDIIFLDLQQNRHEMVSFIAFNFTILGLLEKETV